MAWREWGARTYPSEARNISAGRWDNLREGLAYLAGARMAREQEREQERERARPLLGYMRTRTDPIATSLVAKYEEGGR